MAEKTIQTRVMLKKDTLENFNSENPVLLDGEIAIVEETTNNESSYSLRVGDGTNSFQDLKSLDSVDSGLVEVGGENPPESKKIDLWINIQGESEITIPELNDEAITSGTTWSSFKIDKNNIYCSDTPPIFDKPTDYKDKLWLDTSEQPAVIRRWKGEKVRSDKFVNVQYTGINEMVITSIYEEKFSFKINILPKIENSQFVNLDEVFFSYKVNNVFKNEYGINLITFFETFYAGELTSEGLLSKTYNLYENYQGEFISGKWYSTAEEYIEGAQPTILGVQVLYELETPEIFDLSFLPSYPTFIYTEEGENVITNFSDSDIEIILSTNYSGWETIADLNFNSTNHKVLLYEEIEDLTSII